jgi:hypothetical protein
MSDNDRAWYDDEAGPVVRPYALTRGRTRATSYELDLITLVVARHPSGNRRNLAPEYLRVLAACEHPLSVAEVSANVDLPLGVVKVLISDLIERNYIVFRSSWEPAEGPSLETMQKVLDGIRKL